MDWLSWAPLAAAMLHLFEEFVFPGGFMAWYRRYRDGGARVTVRFLVIINAAFWWTAPILAFFDIAARA